MSLVKLMEVPIKVEIPVKMSDNSQLRNAIDRLREKVGASGITNPPDHHRTDFIPLGRLHAGHPGNGR